MIFGLDWYHLALISALFSAGAAFFEKRALKSQSALSFSFILAVLNLLLSLPFIYMFKSWQTDYVSLLVLYGKTIMGAFSFYFVMKGIKNLELSNALPLLILTPGFVAIVAFVLSKETLTVYQIIGLVLLLSGTYIINRWNKNSLFEPFLLLYKSKGLRFITLALLLFTTTSILDKYLLRDFKIPPYAFLFYQHLFLAFNFSVAVIILKLRSHKTEINSNILKTTLKFIVLVSIFTIIYRYTQIEAVKLGKVALVLTLKRFSVLCVVILSGRFLNEHHIIRKTVATILMLTGAGFVLL